ncbi:MAG: hypothetical protein H0U87_10405 [Acidobacteria bacterium]|nr:hypothetical protein [Acidobacteriota bacterium]
MKRIYEKVKDLVEVREYKSLQEFTSEPQQTLAGYHFTDLTTDLMTKYIDRIAAVQTGEGGAAQALAGYRGVGKSHFLATLGALAANPELRARVTEAHVAASAQQLRRARCAVAHVRRGTHPTLLEELKAAIAKTFEVDAAALNNYSLGGLLSFAAERSGDAPFILIVDTDFKRASRVTRDDGAMLGEIAETAKNLNIFVAVALDDDIAGADGINAAIARSYKIDYLDQEHLYRIVDARLFPKNRQQLPTLHDIYTNFRESMPGFRWSEQRFTALYPLHPVIPEIAPFIRLYAPDFAMLGFAAEAGGKILGRPANSLIALDEVFDATENTLRRVEDLRESFAAYDRINQTVINQISVMQRLQAKLVLKALFLLSLEGKGVTAGEIAAAMLIYDESESQRAVRAVEDLLENFAAAFPDDVVKTAEAGREIHYALKIGGADNLNKALAEAVKKIPPSVVAKVLRRAARERFSEWTLPDESDSQTAATVNDALELSVIWRGGFRRGSLIWNLENRLTTNASGGGIDNTDALDWEITIAPDAPLPVATEESTDTAAKIFWQPAPLHRDEADAILRYNALLSDKTLRERFAESVSAAAHAHALTIEKIWQRVFLEEAKIFIEGFEYELPEAAQTAENLQNLLTNLLEPLFEARFPAHPYFLQTLGAPEVAALVGDFFGGARQNTPETQQLAEMFALPLGLVARQENLYVVQREESLAEMPFAVEILRLTSENPERAVSLDEIYRQLRKAPNGLTREATHLILTALVAQRQIEFVTTKGDRINRRSLDLKIIWNDVEGIVKPSRAGYSSERLLEWARILTGADALDSSDSVGAANVQNEVRERLESRLNAWRESRLLERFEELPDEILNTRAWRLAAHAGKNFGALAEILESVVVRAVSLDEGLQRVADTFSDSEAEFFARSHDLTVLENFVGGAAAREKIGGYLAVCENTDDDEIEFLRERLTAIVEESYKNPGEETNREMENLWHSFRAEFAEHFALKHDAVMKSPQLREHFEKILRSDACWEFENLARLPVFQENLRQEAREIAGQINRTDCRADTRTLLETHPFCACSFSLAEIEEIEKLPAAFEQIVDRGRKSCRRTLRALSQILIPLVEKLAAAENGFFNQEATRLIEILRGDAEREIEFLTNDELTILQTVFADLPRAPLHLSPAAEVDFINDEQLRKGIGEWLGAAETNMTLPTATTNNVPSSLDI